MSDFEALLEAVRRCEAFPDDSSFRSGVRAELERLVDCDRAVFGGEPHRDAGTGQAITLRLPGADRIVLTRRKGEFSERDRELIELIRPHLVRAARQIQARVATARLVSVLEDAARDEPSGLDPAALRALGLTRREGEILHHADRGLSAAEIAAELSVSPRTVHKHLEHVFAKLEVPTRSAALAKVREWSLGALE